MKTVALLSQARWRRKNYVSSAPGVRC